jgi:four helix bundle protein
LTDLKIRQKCEDLIIYGYGALRQFPKSERHVLSQEIRATMLAILRLIIVANRRYFKKTTMQELDAELDILRSQIRIAMELQFLPFQKYEVWSRHVDEIGRMVGGWMKSLGQDGS